MPEFPGLNPNGLVVTETSNLREANDDGSRTVPSGETRTLAENYTGGNKEMYLYAVGATDALNVTYDLLVGNEIVFSTETPLGGVNEPFSFVEALGSPLPAGSRVRYRANNQSGSETDFVCRMFLMEV